MFDTYSQSAGGAKATVRAGGKSWYFITVDYDFGHALEADTAKAVKALGGTVVGAVRHPLNAPDFASYLLQEIGRAHVELQSLMRISYAVFCLKKKKTLI